VKTHILAVVGLLVALNSMPASAAPALDCRLRFDLSSWSIIYKRSTGTGTVTCTNGQSLKVKLTANGGGLSLGKTEVKGGTGNFSDIQTINDVLGTYAQAAAGGGVAKTGEAQVMVKGNVSLSLAGAGSGGAGLGVTIGGFTIEKADGT
jgi:hypothetical protein